MPPPAPPPLSTPLLHPHLCSLPQCVEPYVGNGTFCALDIDGDSYPAQVPEVICNASNTASYCMKDSCPNVPNTDPDDRRPCDGFDGMTCVALLPVYIRTYVHDNSIIERHRKTRQHATTQQKSKTTQLTQLA